jgi:hypothetical protein
VCHHNQEFIRPHGPEIRKTHDQDPGITFGSFSGEGISSKRTAGAGQFNLSLFTNSTNRLSILQNGNVGIGTTAPETPLEVQVAAGQSLQFRQDSGLVPGINVKTTGGLAGIMRFRNSLEVWPSDDATRAGRVDVRNTAGSQTISLDVQTGVASFRNMPGISFTQSAIGGTHLVPGLPPGDLDVLTVNAPAGGFIFVTASAYAETSQGGDYLFDFTLSNEGASLVNTKAQSRIDPRERCDSIMHMTGETQSRYHAQCQHDYHSGSAAEVF